MRGHRDLEIAVGAAFFCAVGALLLPVEFLRLLFAAPLVLFLPGYAIAAAALSKRELAPAQLLPVGVGLSLATLVVGALLLNYLPGGLRAGTWALLLFLVVLAAARGAALRRRGEGHGVFANPSWPHPSALGVALLATGAVAATAAVALAFVPVSAKHAIGFTELWIRPYDGAASGVKVGVGSQEKDDVSYRLVVRFGSGGRPVASRFTLEPGETRVVRIAATPSSSGTSVPVSATLFLADRPGVPYRQVSASIPPPAETSG